MPVLNKELEFDIEEFSDETFNLEQSIIKAKEIIESLVVENRWIRGDFEDDCWEVAKLQYYENYSSFDFSKLDSALFNKNSPHDFKDIAKCWTVHLIDKYKQAAVSYHIQFLKSFEITKGFRRQEKGSLLKYIEYCDYSNKYKVDLIISLCNFFDFSDLEIGEDYVPSLINLKNKIPVKRNIRQLPPSRYVLSFSYYLEKHFERLLNDSLSQAKLIKELLLIFPLVIWWRLTNIIPMRPTEFCLIERNCIFINNGKHYIKLPRNKLKNTKRIQIPDTLLIDKELYQLIERYVEITNKYGKTDTLISYRSLISGDPSTNRAAVTKNLNQFKSHNLDALIKRFYKTMETIYDCEIVKEHHISPNDTRHFAFVSLMMQGYSPIEIARLGGHQTIRAQYHYNGHSEYWADCEVFKLMKKVKNSKIVAEHTGTIPDEVKLKAYDDDGTFKKKMKIGYCKDEEQSCETKLCYFCSRWGITPDEYIEKKEQIKSDILAMKNNINELAAIIRNLNKQFLSDELSRRNPELLSKIKTKANEIQSDIYKLALLCSKIGGGEVLDGEKVRWS
ncbi:site-specific integrase [Neobacillus drentensis]|uniref:site-specific integrase n=1 Tax=Neobacillus drentensis TaxID=220684 RepID=UPI00300074ED